MYLCTDARRERGDLAEFANAVLAGGVRIGAGALIGAGAVVRPGISIGAGAVIGAGAAVVEDIAAGARVAGVPARRVQAPEI